MEKTNRIDEIEKLWGPYKNYPLTFAEHPDVNTLLDSIPYLVAEVRRLQDIQDTLVRLITRDTAFIKKLEAVHEAAERLHRICQDAGWVGPSVAELGKTLAKLTRGGE